MLSSSGDLKVKVDLLSDTGYGKYVPIDSNTHLAKEDGGFPKILMTDGLGRTTELTCFTKETRNEIFDKLVRRERVRIPDYLPTTLANKDAFKLLEAKGFGYSYIIKAINIAEGKSKRPKHQWGIMSTHFVNDPSFYDEKILSILSTTFRNPKFLWESHISPYQFWLYLLSYCIPAVEETAIVHRKLNKLI